MERHLVATGKQIRRACGRGVLFKLRSYMGGGRDVKGDKWVLGEARCEKETTGESRNHTNGCVGRERKRVRFHSNVVRLHRTEKR